MIDLTPLDVRKKPADFKKGMLGYDAKEVEDFLALAADRLEELVRENGALSKEIVVLGERCDRLQQQVTGHEDRQNAVQEALIMAQKMREEVRAQAERDAEVAKQRAEAEIKKYTGDAKRGLEDAKRKLGEVQLRRKVFLQSFRSFLEKELKQVELEDGEVSSWVAELEAELPVKADQPPATEPARAEAAPAPSEPPPADTPAPAEPVEDPWISALQSVDVGKKREAGPSN